MAVYPGEKLLATPGLNIMAPCSGSESEDKIQDESPSYIGVNIENSATNNAVTHISLEPCCDSNTSVFSSIHTLSCPPGHETPHPIAHPAPHPAIVPRDFLEASSDSYTKPAIYAQNGLSQNVRKQYTTLQQKFSEQICNASLDGASSFQPRINASIHAGNTLQTQVSLDMKSLI